MELARIVCPIKVGRSVLKWVINHDIHLNLDESMLIFTFVLFLMNRMYA